VVLTWFEILPLLLMPLLLFSLWVPLLLPQVKQTPTQRFMRFALILMLGALLGSGAIALYLQLR
jgi:hypothetical protein